MELLRRLKQVLGAPDTTTTYSITLCRCEECGSTFESRTAPRHAHCPDCDSTAVRPADADGDR